MVNDFDFSRLLKAISTGVVVFAKCDFLLLLNSNSAPLRDISLSDLDFNLRMSLKAKSDCAIEFPYIISN